MPAQRAEIVVELVRIVNAENGDGDFAVRCFDSRDIR